MRLELTDIVERYATHYAASALLIKQVGSITPRRPIDDMVRSLKLLDASTRHRRGRSREQVHRWRGDDDALPVASSRIVGEEGEVRVFPSNITWLTCPLTRTQTPVIMLVLRIAPFHALSTTRRR